MQEIRRTQKKSKNSTNENFDYDTWAIYPYQLRHVRGINKSIR